ncbi:MAG: NPCBM/NEW2 domain-containing protein [Planctomycetaceae bacterium]|nr:NPCBM/NEW2 domain-containing protein [Planctomycetaceae bacterium]
MSQDLYTLWLGIAAGPRPVDHYTLLGVKPFCQDQDAIEQAVRRRMDKLDQYALHPDRAKRQAVQNMMNELAAARVRLVNPEQKLRYDQTLAAALGVSAPASSPAVAAPADAPDAKRSRKPRDIFVRRLRSHLLKWSMDAHEERLLVAEAAAVGIGESEALKIIRHMDAEAERIAGKWRRKVTAGIVAMVIAGAAAIFAFVLLPAMMRSKTDSQFDAHIAAARDLIEKGNPKGALAELDQAQQIKKADPLPAQLRLRAQGAVLVDEAAAALREGHYEQAAQKLTAAEKLQGDGSGAPALRAQALEVLTRQIDSAVAAGNASQAIALLKGVQILAGQDPLVARLSESIRALQRKLVLDEVPKDLEAGRYAAALAKIDDLKRLGESSAATDALLRQHSAKLAQTFRAQWSARQWAPAAATATARRQISGDAGEWDILPLLGRTTASDAAAAAAWARELVAAAAHPATSPWPAFRTALLKAAIPAAMKDPAGDAGAWQAAQVLAVVEGPDGAAGEWMAALLRARIERTDAPQDKDKLTRRLIALLTAMAKQSLAEGNQARAQKYAAQANTAAAAIFLTTQTEPLVKQAAAAEALCKELVALRAKAHGGDPGAAERIFHICWVELDDKDSAARWAEHLPAADAETFILATLDRSSLSDAQCSQVEEWYKRLAQTPQISDAAKDRMLKLADEYGKAAASRTQPKAPAKKPAPAKEDPAMVPDVELAGVTWVKGASEDARVPPTFGKCSEGFFRNRVPAVAGRQFKNGLNFRATSKGAAAAAQVVYDLDPKWKAFVAQVGLDDISSLRNPTNAGPCIAEVFIDDKSVFKSRPLEPGAEAVPVVVVIPPESKRIRLTAEISSSRTRCFVTWGNPGFQLTLKAVPAPATAAAATKVSSRPVPPAPTVFLGDLKPVEASTLWGAVTADHSPLDNQPLRIAGTEYPRGLGLHAPARVTYELTAGYKSFVARVGVHTHAIKALDGTLGGSIVASVLIDGKIVDRSGVLRYADPPWNVNVPIPAGAKQITLVTTSAGDASNPDLADWAVAGFVTNATAPKTPAQPPADPSQTPSKALQEILAALDAAQYDAAAAKAAAFRQPNPASGELDAAIAPWVRRTSTAFINALNAKAPPAYQQAATLARAVRAVTAPDAPYNVNLLMGLEGAAQSGPEPSLELARKLLEAAAALTGEPELASALRLAAYDRALAHPENLEQAQKLLADLAAAHRTEYQPKLLPAFRKNYESLPAGNAKLTAGLSLVALLMDVGSAAIVAGQWDHAAKAYEEAQALAPGVESPHQREIQLRLKLVRSRQTYITQAAEAAQALELAEPDTASTLRKRLFTLHYVELGDVANAAAYADADEANIEPQRLMALPIKDLAPEQFAALERWHRDLGAAENVSQTGAERMAAKAAEYARRRRALLMARPLVINNATIQAAMDNFKETRVVATALTVNGLKQALAPKGAGTLIVGGQREVNLQVGARPDGACAASLDLSGLARLFANLDEMTVGLGRRAPADTAHATGQAALKLAPISVVQAEKIIVGRAVGAAGEGMSGTLDLAADTTLQANSIEIASGPAAQGALTLPKSARLRLRGRNGGNTPVKITLGAGAADAATPASAVLDLGGGWTDARISTLETAPQGSHAAAAVTMGIGTVEADAIILRKGADASRPTTLTLAGTTLLVNKTLTIEEGAVVTLAPPDPAAAAPAQAAAAPAAPAKASLRMPANGETNRTLLENYIKTGQITAAAPSTLTIRQEEQHLIVEPKP